MSRFSTTLDVSKELKGFEGDSGDEIEDEAESSGSERENKSKKGRNYAEEFEVYDKEEEMDEEMDKLDSEFNGESEAKTVSEDTPEKVVVEEYNVKKKHRAEFVDADEIAEPKDKDDDGDKRGKRENDRDEGEDDSSDDSGDEGGDDGGEPRKAGGGKNNGKDDDSPGGKISWLWVSILIILIIAAGIAGYLVFKNAKQHAAETNLSEFPGQIATDLELAKQNLSQDLNMSIAEELEPAAGENETEQVEPTEENISEEIAPAEESNESNASALKDVLIQGLS